MHLSKAQAYDVVAPILPNSTAETKALLRRIRNTNRKALVGSHGAWNTISSLSGGRYPAIYGFEHQAGRNTIGPQIVSANAAGSIITLSDHMPNVVNWAGYGAYNPNTGSDPQSNGCYDRSTNVTAQILAGGAPQAAFDSYVNSLADWISSLMDADGKKIPVLLRPLHEQNGDWFWWHKIANAAELVSLTQRYIGLLQARGVTNAVIVWCPTANNAVGTPLYYADINPFFPGASYCDVIGLDIYSNALNGSLRHGWVRSAYAASEQIAGENNKPLGLAELGFGESAWLWTYTSESFWDQVVFPQIKAEFASVRYIAFWNGQWAPGIGKATSDGAAAMLSDSYWQFR